MLINNTIESSKRPGIPGPHRPDLKWFKDALDGKSDVGHVHQKKDITDFEHTHDGRYYRKDEHELQLLLSGNGTPNFNQGINGDYYVDELNGDLYKKSGDAWNLIIHLEGEQGIPGPQGNPGVPGPQGNPGEEGYTPVRGTDYWTPEDEEIIRQSIVSEVQLGLSGKVDKVEGKGLSTEDFTTLLKQKLEELQNYDDRDIRELLEKALYNVTIDVKTGILTFHTIDESTFTVDLPLELIVSDGYLNKDTNTIVLVLANGNTIDIPVENLIKDFYSKSEVDQKIDDLAEEVAIDFETVDEKLAKAQAQIDALKAENEAQQKELDVLYNDLVPGEASGETAVVANGVTGSKVEIDGDGNTIQEVIEAVEGTTVVDTNMNLTDVDTTFENSLLPMGNISQETREAYQLLSTDEANLTVVQGSDAAHLQYYDDGFINAFNNVTDAETELIYTIPTKHITSGKKYTLGIEYKYTNRPSVYLRNAANDDSVKALSTNSASSIKLTNTANSNYMSVSVILKANASATFRLTLAEGTEQKPWQTYDPDYVIPSLKYPSPVKGVGSEEDINLARLEKEGYYRQYGTGNFAVNESYNSQIASVEPNKTYTIKRIAGDHSNIAFFSKDMTYLSGLAQATTITTPDNCYFVTVAVSKNATSFMIYEGTEDLPYTPYGYCRYETVVGNKNLFKEEYENKNQNGDAKNNRLLSTPIKLEDLYYTVQSLPADIYYAFSFYDSTDISQLKGNSTWNNSIQSGKIIDNFNSKYVRVMFKKGANGTDTITKYDLQGLELQIEKGSATDYIKHQSQSLPIDIPVGQEWYSGKPYKLNGKWYRDVEWEKKHPKEFNWSTANNTNIENTNFNRFVASYSQDVLDASTINTYSNILPSKTANELWLNDIIGVGQSKSQITIRLPKSVENGTKVAEYFGENGYLLLKHTPIREEITDETLIEQLEALQNAEFYDGVTNINSYASSEDVAEMPLEAHYNFITPAPSLDRDSEVEIAESPNMLDVHNLSEKASKVGIAVDEDDYVTGVSEDSRNWSYENSNWFKTLKAGTYTIYVFVKNKPVSVNALMHIYQKGNSSSIGYISHTALQSSIAKVTITLLEDTEIGIMFKVFDGIFRIMLIKGTRFLPYLSYGKIGLAHRTKNELDIYGTRAPNTIYTEKGVTLSFLEGGKLNLKGTSTESIDFYIRGQWNNPTGKICTFRKGINTMYLTDKTNDTKNPVIMFFVKNVDGVSSSITNVTTKKQIQVDEDIDCTAVMIRVPANITLDMDLYPMLYHGSGDDTFVPYHQEIIPIDLQGNKLAKLPNGVKDNLLIGLDGKCSIGDKLIKEYTFTGDENWIRYDAGNYAVFYADILTDSKKVASYPYCNYLKSGNYGAANDKVIMIDKNGRVHIRIDKFKTVDELKTFLKQNTVKILYPLEIPETITLPSIEPITLFEGTNIFELVTSLPTTLTAHYKVSSKKQLIENNDRLTALEATVNTLLGGN